MKVEAVGKIQMESINRDKEQEALKKSISEVQEVYDQSAINSALKRGELKEQEIKAREERLRVYLEKHRELNNTVS